MPDLFALDPYTFAILEILLALLILAGTAIYVHWYNS